MQYDDIYKSKPSNLETTMYHTAGILITSDACLFWVGAKKVGAPKQELRQIKYSRDNPKQEPKKVDLFDVKNGN